MIISKKHKFLFIHIQKTGGSTISRLLRQHFPDAKPLSNMHAHSYEAKNILKDAYQDYYSFAFVRNPWERLVSWYTMIQEKAHLMTSFEKVVRLGRFYNRLWQYAHANSNNFEEFLINCTEEIKDKSGTRSFAYNQLDYLTDPQGNVIVDEIFRFEDFLGSSKKLFKKLDNIELDLIPKENPSKHKHYTEYYSEASKELVAERFSKDIAYFGYKFGQ